MPPDTAWIIEAECDFTLSKGAWTEEASACAVEAADVFRYSAFTDGGDWADADGTLWGWTDFPPDGVA